MYGRLEHLVPDAPPELSTLPPERVGEAVVKAIRENRAEVIVNRRPVKPAAILAVIAPSLLVRALRRKRPLEFARRFGEARKRVERGQASAETEAPPAARR